MRIGFIGNGNMGTAIMGGIISKGVAEPGDIVVLAGKGHESYLEVRGKRTHYDEREVVAGILAGKL